MLAPVVTVTCMNRWLVVLACAASSAFTACGGSGVSAPLTPPPATAQEAHAESAASGLATSAELGGLDEREAEQSFRDSLDGLQACVSTGIERLEFMGGSIEFAVKVDSSRHAAQVWAAQSSLGERATEKCMFDALRAVSWPAPVGGAFGLARNSFEFELKKGVAAPAVWDAGRVASVVNAVDGPLHQCRGDAAGDLLITLYVGQGGKALAAGAASEAPLDEAAVDCVVDTLLAAEYPHPQRSPTKVRFQL
jgi:hypothetical protein